MAGRGRTSKAESLAPTLLVRKEEEEQEASRRKEFQRQKESAETKTRQDRA